MPESEQNLEEDELRMLSGLDNEPFTRELEAELLGKGWKLSDIEAARAEGGMYNRRRDSVFFPVQFEGEMFEKDPTPASERIGRNDPCPCGSGRKYKKCHGAMK